jgi:hypothetical protein
VRCSWLSHLLRSSVISANSRVLFLFEQMSMFSAVSLLPQLGHFSSKHSRPENFPTWTLVPQKTRVLFGPPYFVHVGLGHHDPLRCSQSTSGHAATSLCQQGGRGLFPYLRNQTGWDTSLEILFPQITMAMSSCGNIWVRVLMYPVAMAL